MGGNHTYTRYIYMYMERVCSECATQPAPAKKKTNLLHAHNPA